MNRNLKFIAALILCLAAFNVRAQSKVKQETGQHRLSLALRSWCVNQHWLGSPRADGSIEYRFIGEWTDRSKKNFIFRCDKYSRMAGKNAHAQTPQKTAESIPIAPETAQEIITAYEAQENARLAYVAAQAKSEAILNKAKAQAKCWPCSLNRNAQGQLVLIPDPPTKEKP